MIIPLIVLGIVFLLIALRDIGKVRLQIWQVMLGGAVVVLLTGQISPLEAFHAINFDVICFLFGMFVVGQATEDSGYLTHLCNKLFGKVKSVDKRVLAILFSMGLGSAVLMNDTIAIIGTPILLLLSKKKPHFKLTYIALVGCAPVLIYRSFWNKMRFHILRRIDWFTLIFFVAMFVLMESAWNTGFFQTLISSLGLDIKSIGIILILAVVVSQLTPNVPMVALFLPLLISADPGVKQFLALAAGSTIAGNLFILGAASNIIILQHAEKENAGESITFFEFAEIGVPLTAMNAAVYWGFLVYL